MPHKIRLTPTKTASTKRVDARPGEGDKSCGDRGYAGQDPHPRVAASRRGESELSHPGVDEGHGEHGHQGRDGIDPRRERGHAQRDRDEPAEHEQPPPAGRLPCLLRDVSDRIEQGIPKRTGHLVRLIGLLRFHSFLQSIPAGRRSSPRQSLLVAFGRRSRRRPHRHGNWRSHVMGSSDGCSSLGLTAAVGSQHAGRMSRHPPNRMDMGVTRLRSERTSEEGVRVRIEWTETVSSVGERGGPGGDDSASSH